MGIVEEPALGPRREGNPTPLTPAGSGYRLARPPVRCAALRAAPLLRAHFDAVDPRRSLEYTLEGMATARRLGMANFAYYHAANLPRPAIRLGEWDLLLSKVEELADGLYDALTRAEIGYAKADVLRLRGEDVEDRSTPQIEQAQATGDEQMLQNGLSTRIWEAFTSGDLEIGTDAAERLLASHRLRNMGVPIADGGRVALHARNVDLAQRIVDAMRGGPGGAHDGDIAAMEAGVLALRGDVEEALTAYRTALGTYQHFGLRFDTALTGLDMAVLLPLGLPGVAAVASESRRILTELGARPFLARLDAVAPAESAETAARASSISGPR